MPVGGSRCLAAVQLDASQKGKVPFAIVLASTMRNLTYTENADMHFQYGRANGNVKTALRMNRVQFPDRRMPDHRIF
ncbi:hypothetical protein TNCV_249851 [Trichonephila clavipes]|nr:hypothetical protein TNCV_249851 [Trichonephila clavipes]